MKFLRLVFLVSSASITVAAATQDSIGISPVLLRRSFNSTSDTTDYFLAGSVTGASMTISERSVHLLDQDTVLRPEHENELSISYASIERAKAAYTKLYNAALNRQSGLYKALEAGALLGRSGSWIIVRWMRQDTDRFGFLPGRKYFKSDQFDESFEVWRGAKKLK